MKGEMLQLISQKLKGSQETTMNTTNKQDNLEEMNKFLEMHNVPRLNNEEIENLNRLITGKETELVIFQQTKVQDQTASQVNSTKHSKKN